MDSLATDLGTKTFFSQLNLSEDKIRNFLGLSVSSLGLGTYLGGVTDEEDELYFQSIKKSILLGINFIDTAINYRCQRSEKIIGKVLKALEEEKIYRNQIVLSTKGGFLSCEDNYGNFEEYINKTYIDTHIISENDIVEQSHCIHPRFLESQINKSLQNMGIECIDVYYLHNPEIQLFHLDQKAFYNKLRDAFIFFEKMVSEKKIATYGLATWSGFRQKRGSKGYLDLEEIVAIAKEVKKDHNFTCVQIPFNLIMTEMLRIKNQTFEDERMTFLDLAQKLNIKVVVSAPLMQSYIKNLPKRIFDSLPGAETALQKALQFILSTSGITSTLIGMKTPKHVIENLELLKIPSWTEEEYNKSLELLHI